MKFKFLSKLAILLLLASCETTQSSSLAVSSPLSNSSNSSSSSLISSTTSASNDNILTYDIELEIKDNERKIELDASSFYNIGTYDTGNYVNRYKSNAYTFEGINFEYYRAVRNSSEMFTLLPYYSKADDGTLPGAFYNTNRVESINRVIIEYKNDDSNSQGFSFSYSSDNYNFERAIASGSSEFRYIQANCDKSSYFRIETLEQTLCINKVFVYYSGTVSNRQSYSSGQDAYRLNPTVYDENLVDGVSSVDIPIDIKVKDDGTYEVVATKKLTYYSNEYVLNNPNVAQVASYTDPRDVAAYTIAFKVRPANYFYSFEDNSYARTVFGDKIRYYSEWDRTDGYVNAVPVSKDKISYCELDIDIGDSYTSASGKVTRGVGRVVVFFNGFIEEGYNTSPVAVYTDDHYATFQEYLNTGEFSRRFSVQSYCNAFDYGSAKTLNP